MVTRKITEANATEKILSSATREFAEYGLAGARVDRIASRAGVNKAMIYYYFRSKENLYQTVIGRHFSKIRALADEIIDVESSPEALFLRCAEFYGSLFEERENIVPILIREVASGGERIRRVLKPILTEKRLIRKLKEIFEDGKRKGLFREMDTRHAAISFIGMNLFYLIMAPIMDSVWNIKDKRKFRQERPKEIVNLFLHGIEAK